MKQPSNALRSSEVGDRDNLEGFFIPFRSYKRIRAGSFEVGLSNPSSYSTAIEIRRMPLVPEAKQLSVPKMALSLMGMESGSYEVHFLPNRKDKKP
jgi:hypothetical protein